MIFVFFGSNIVMLASFLLRFNRLPPQIPLYYSMPWGKQQLADGWMIMFLPLFLNIMFIINYLFYRRVFKGSKLTKKLFNALDIFLAVSITLIFVRILFLVT